MDSDGISDDEFTVPTEPSALLLSTSTAVDKQRTPEEASTSSRPGKHKRDESCKSKNNRNAARVSAATAMQSMAAALSTLASSSCDGKRTDETATNDVLMGIVKNQNRSP